MMVAILGRNMKRVINNVLFSNFFFVLFFDGIFIDLITGVPFSFFVTSYHNVIFVEVLYG
jgi:hypothetical protein